MSAATATTAAAAAATTTKTTTKAALAAPSHRNTFTSPSSTPTRPTHKKNMSITQTYYLAHKARAKLAREAAQPDHDLRLLVGHANLLDSLMLELVDAEREQERWFNQSVRGAGKTSDGHVRWADKVAEQTEEEYDSASSDSASDSDSESDSDMDDEDDVPMIGSTISVRPSTTAASTSTSSTAQQSQPQPQSQPQSQSQSQSQSRVVVVVSERDDTMSDDDDDYDDLQEDYSQLELVRTPSHASSPPELLLDQDSESSDDDESLPPSPTDRVLEYAGKEAKAQTMEEEIMESDYYISRQPSRGLVTAISVY